MNVAITAALAWGALSFGANYPWAYWPLLALSVITGVWGVLRGSNPLPRSLLLALGGIVAAICLQLLPLPSVAVARIAPATDTFLHAYDVAYALADGRTWHPLSVAPARTWIALLFFVAFSCLVLGIARYHSASSLARLVPQIVILGVVLAVIGIVQRPLYAGAIYGVWQPLMEGNPFGPFVNKNHFAGWMLMATPLAFGYWSALVDRAHVPHGLRKRLLWLASPHATQIVLVGCAVALMMLAMTLTMSRSAMLAIPFGLAVVARGIVTQRWALTTRAASISCLIGCLVVVAMWVGTERIRSRFEEPRAVHLNGRLEIWKDALDATNDFGIVGAGLNTFGTLMLHYQRASPEFHVREAHNDYLQLAVEGGVLLVVPILCTLLAFAVVVVKAFRAAPGGMSYWLRLGAVGGIVAIAVQSTAEFSLQMPANAALFAVLCGIAAHGAERSRQSRTPTLVSQ